MTMVVRPTSGVHGQPAILAGRPLYPQSAQVSSSELGDQLGPDRDHPDEQRDRRQRRRFFHESLQHPRLPGLEHMENNVPFLFSGVKGRSWVCLRK